MTQGGIDRRGRRSLVDRRLRVQLLIFALVFVVLLALAVHRVIADDVSILWAVLGLAIGAGIGRALARTKVLSWNEQDRVVVGRMDILGGAILVGYLVVVLLRGQVLGDVLGDARAAGVVTLAMTAGAMAGRVIFTARGIRQLLRALGAQEDMVKP